MRPTQRLRQLLQGSDLVTIPTCFDALSAKLIEQAGFSAAFMSGAAVATTRLGMPDTGLITLTEMTDQLRNMCAATTIPVIGDGDTGYGNAVNVRRTIHDYARAGAACVMIEDQVTPKRCGHFEGKQVLSREEARMKIRAAVDAAKEVDILILARTDVRAIEGFDAAMQRCRDFEEEGADIIFLEAPISEQELSTFAKEMRQPTMANIVAGGKTPELESAALKALGIRVAIYHPLIFSVIRAMEDTLAALRSGDASRYPALASFVDLKRVGGLAQYDELSARYAVKST